MTPALPVVPMGSGAAALDTLLWRLARELAEERRKRLPQTERAAVPAAAEEPPGEAAEPLPWRDLSLAAVWRACHAALAAVAREDRLPLLSEVAYSNAALTDLKGALLLLAETPPDTAEPNREEPDGDEPPDPVEVLLSESAPGLPPPAPVPRPRPWRTCSKRSKRFAGAPISTAPWFAELRSSPPRFAVLFHTLLEMAKSQTVRLEQPHPEADLLVAPAGS